MLEKLLSNFSVIFSANVFGLVFSQDFRPPPPPKKKKITPKIHAQNSRHSSPTSLSRTQNNSPRFSAYGRCQDFVFFVVVACSGGLREPNIFTMHASAKENLRLEFVCLSIRKAGANQIAHRVARLQNEVCTKEFFELRNSSREMLRNFPEMFEPLLCGSEKIRKIPAKFPARFPGAKSRKIYRRASAGAQGEQILICNHGL